VRLQGDALMRAQTLAPLASCANLNNLDRNYLPTPPFCWCDGLLVTPWEAKGKQQLSPEQEATVALVAKAALGLLRFAANLPRRLSPIPVAGETVRVVWISPTGEVLSTVVGARGVVARPAGALCRVGDREGNAMTHKQLVSALAALLRKSAFEFQPGCDVGDLITIRNALNSAVPREPDEALAELAISLQDMVPQSDIDAVLDGLERMTDAARGG
jgi:hypothetical protein